MALNIDADYDEVVISFDPNTFGIIDIKARNSVNKTEQGTLDRVSRDAADALRLGLYNPMDADIQACVNEVIKRRKKPTANPPVGAALIYKFSTDNEVDMTHAKSVPANMIPYFMIADPIFSEICRKENRNIFGNAGTTTTVSELCVVGTIRVKEASS